MIIFMKRMGKGRWKAPEKKCSFVEQVGQRAKRSEHKQTCIYTTGIDCVDF